jgi:hypothetical protein
VCMAVTACQLMLRCFVDYKAEALANESIGIHGRDVSSSH